MKSLPISRPRPAGSSFRPVNGRRDQCAMSPHPLVERAVLLAHRLAGYAALTLIDDAAIMAMMFC